MKIRHELVAGFTTVVLLVTAVGIVSLLQLHRMAQPLRQDIPEAVAAAARSERQDSLAQLIRYYDEVLTQSARNFAFTDDPKWQQRYQDAEPKLDAAIKEALRDGDENDRGLFASIDKANLALVGMEYRSMELVHAGRAKEAVAVLDSREYWDQKTIYQKGLTDYAQRRAHASDDALDASAERIQSASRLAQRLLRASIPSVLGVVIAAVLLSTAIGLVISRSISRPLKQLRMAAVAIGRGDLNVVIGVPSDDEMGQLAGSFREMAANLRDTTASIDSLNREIAERQRTQAELLAVNNVLASEITRREQAQAEQQASEEKFRVLFEVSSDAIMTLEPPTWRFTSGNPTTVKMFQARDEAQFVTKGPGEVSPEFQPDGTRSDDKAKAMILKAMQEGSNFFEWDHRRLEGEVFPTTVLLTRVALGERVFLQATVRDVTDAKKVERRLAYLASFPERNASPILELDLEGNVRYANPAALSLFPDLSERGAAHPWLADWATVAGPFRAGQTDIGVRDITVGERSYEQRFRYFAADRFVRMYAADITERRAAAEHIRQNSQIQATLNGLLGLSLEDLTMEEMLKQAIDHITSTAGFALESKGAMFLTDDKQEALVMTAQRGMGAPLLTMCARVPFGRCTCGRAALSGEVEFVDCVDERHENTFEGIHPHGHYCVPILSGGRVLGVINTYVKQGHLRRQEEEDFLQAAAAVLAGVIERKKAEEQQTQLLQKLSEINQELQDFAHIVSHDLKAPLRAIRTLADWLSADYQDQLDEQGKENLRLLGSRVDRMQNLIDGVLQYSRVGHTEQGAAPVDLGRIVPEIIENLGAPEHISIRVASGLPTVEADATRITQVFQNLLSNAIKYMDKPEGDIAVGCVEEEGFWKFSVCDNGPGIEEKHFERIFKLFQTLAPRDSNESTGVGLTITKKIVEMYGGRIWVESEVGKGSTFFFTLPRQRREVSDAPVRTDTACTL